jgi:hypothetical protein
VVIPWLHKGPRRLIEGTATPKRRYRDGFRAVNPNYYIDTLGDFEFELKLKISSAANSGTDNYFINFSDGNIFDIDYDINEEGSFRGFSITWDRRYSRSGGFGIVILKSYDKPTTNPNFSRFNFVNTSKFGQNTSFPLHAHIKISYDFSTTSLTGHFIIKDSDDTTILYDESDTITIDINNSMNADATHDPAQYLKYMTLGTHPWWQGTGTGAFHYISGIHESLTIRNSVSGL